MVLKDRDGDLEREQDGLSPPVSGAWILAGARLSAVTVPEGHLRTKATSPC